MRVLMVPHLANFDKEESGIKRVVEAYHSYSRQFGIEFVACPIAEEGAYDLFAIHAGTTNLYPANKPIVAHLHGLYWTADYAANIWEWRANMNVIESIRRATLVTVPSEWVAESIRRDARVNPYVLHHGVEAQKWESQEHDSYILWNKNRNMDVCDPRPVGELAKRFPDMWFVTTFSPSSLNTTNIEVVGLLPKDVMKGLVQRARVYLSTTKETFGIGTLEALAAGTPVLGFDHGGNREIVRHGVNGYLAQPNNIDDLAEGLKYIMRYWGVLSKNAIISARAWTWEKPMQKLAEIYQEAIEIHADKVRPRKIDEALFKV